MTVLTLRSKKDIEQARMILRLQGLSCEPQGLSGLLGRMGFRSATALGGWLKSWDVQRTAEFISKNVDKDQSLLDIGAYASEILCVLRRMGFDRLHGIDLDMRLGGAAAKMGIWCQIGDFYRCPYPDQSFVAVTAISVIEHGYRDLDLFREVSRLLKPGGYFVASFDYWPNKLDTSGMRLFEMDWKIFSREDVLSLLNAAAKSALYPLGSVELDAAVPVIDWAGRSYTFAWMVLQKEGSRTRGGPSIPDSAGSLLHGILG